MAGKLLQGLVGVVSILVLAVSSLMVFAPVDRVAAAQDCDANAVIYCGVTGLADLRAKYNQNQGGNVQAIFAHFGIPNEAFLDDMYIGRVTKAGDVYIGDWKVATNAVTAGRQNMPGSTKIPGIEAYQRPPSVSFRSDSLEALVKMDQGRFVVAVLTSCGNPVKATPIAKPAPKPPAPKPQPKPAPKPVPKHPKLQMSKEIRVVGDATWSKRVTADSGDTIEYRITVTNTGDTPLQNVEIQDSLPTEVSFEDAALEGSTGVNEFMVSELVGRGILIDSLYVDDKIEIIFTVTVGDTVDACDVPFKNIAYASADDVPEEQDYALAKVCQPETPVNVVKAVKTPPPAPKLPETGAAGVLVGFSITSFLGFAVYKLKDLYANLLR